MIKFSVNHTKSKVSSNLTKEVSTHRLKFWHSAKKTIRGFRDKKSSGIDKITTRKIGFMVYCKLEGQRKKS